MTRLAYSRLPTSEGDVEIQMPEPPKRTRAVCKYVAPCLFLFGFLIVYMDVLSFDMLPNNFLPFRKAKSIENSFEISSLRSKIATRTLPTTSKSISTTTAMQPTTTQTTKATTTTTKTPASTKTSNTTTTTAEPTPSFELTMSNGAVFRRRKEVAHVDCARLLKDDKEYAKEICKRRPRLSENATLDMSCEAIQKRVLPARNPDTGFPILYTRIVYMDYEFLEDQLATNYAIENVFCFTIDKKAIILNASIAFHERIFNLEKCLPNVIVAKKEHDVDSAGHNHNEAHLDCMAAMRDRKWEYAMLLQNHDVMIKTHNEMTEILRIYGGANEIEVVECNRCPSTLEKNLGKLDLCPKSLRGKELAKCRNSSIQFGKGMIQMILSRAAVDFIFDEINIRPVMKELNDMVYGVDEELYQTLQITPEIRLPGGFHYKCRSKESQFISRITIWTGNCRSGKVRHSICIFGVEDLPFLAESKYVMANKMMPEFDQAVTSCISELLFNRTRDGSTIDRKYYENISAVRYHHERNKPGFNIDKFQCVV